MSLSDSESGSNSQEFAAVTPKAEVTHTGIWRSCYHSERVPWFEKDEALLIERGSLGLSTALVAIVFNKSLFVYRA